MKIEEGLTFDDVLLKPRYSELASRADVDLSVTVEGIWFATPIVPANMKTITGASMVQSVQAGGDLAVLHRFMPLEEQVEIVKRADSARIGVSVGAKFDDREAALKLHDAGARIICVDIAHGESMRCEWMVEWLRKTFADAVIIAGNVATAEGALRLWDAGAHVVKVGVGPGSLCTTRIETGCGVPQLSALIDIADIKGDRIVIADGGVRTAGDMVKALCFADMVMSGFVFAGCEETPGREVEIDGRQYKEYVGSSTHKTGHVEGVEALVPRRGSYRSIMQRLVDGIRSGCSYQGVRRVKDLQKDPHLVRVTNAGIRESNHHDVMVGST